MYKLKYIAENNLKRDNTDYMHFHIHGQWNRGGGGSGRYAHHTPP